MFSMSYIHVLWSNQGTLYYSYRPRCEPELLPGRKYVTQPDNTHLTTRSIILWDEATVKYTFCLVHGDYNPKYMPVDLSLLDKSNLKHKLTNTSIAGGMNWLRNIHSLTQYNTIQYNMIWYDMIWYDMIWNDTIWYDTTWHDTTWHNMTWHDMIRYNTIRYDMTQHNTTRHNTYNTIQYNTIQCNTIQYNTMQYDVMRSNTTQHNTILEKKLDGRMYPVNVICIVIYTQTYH